MEAHYWPRFSFLQATDSDQHPLLDRAASQRAPAVAGQGAHSDGLSKPPLLQRVIGQTLRSFHITTPILWRPGITLYCCWMPSKQNRAKSRMGRQNSVWTPQSVTLSITDPNICCGQKLLRTVEALWRVTLMEQVNIKWGIFLIVNFNVIMKF